MQDHEHLNPEPDVNEELSADKRVPTSSTGSGELSEIESKLGPAILNHLEDSVSKDKFAEQLNRAKRCPRTPTGSEEFDELLAGYVIVTKEDAMEAMACYLAAWLSSVPEAQTMEPAKLQHAIISSLKEMKQTKLRMLLQWGRYAYRGASFAYSAFMVYQNPWLVRAIVSVLWTAGCAIAERL